VLRDRATFHPPPDGPIIGLWFPCGHQWREDAPGRSSDAYCHRVTGVHRMSGRAQAALEAIAQGSVAITTRALAPVGVELTFAQWRVLVIVGEKRPDGATISEVATRLGAEISPVSRLVSRLARRGLVETQKDPHDRRVTRVVLTKAGLSIRETVMARRRELLTGVLLEIGPLDPIVEAALERIGSGLSTFT